MLLVMYGPGPDAPAPVPARLVIASTRGVESVPIATEAGHPAVAAAQLVRLLPVQFTIENGWANVFFARQEFRFLLGAPLFLFRDELTPLVGGAYLLGDSLYVPLQWLTQHVPRLFSEGYRYDPTAGRFEELGMTPVVTRVSGSVRPAPEAARRLGLREAHKVVIDPGHGGRDPGTRGRYLPRGVQEKQVVLRIAKQLEKELKARGVEVAMTRRTDVLIPFRDRARLCRADCDVFVSIHVNSMPDGRRNRSIRGVETYFFREALTADAARVAAMENEALRYEADAAADSDDPMSFIWKDLERNEYLRESAQLAEAVHDHVAGVHPGGPRRMAQANFAVLRMVNRPAILVETGYGSNPSDGRYLASTAGQHALAVAIADGIIEYLRRYETKTISTPRP